MKYTTELVMDKPSNRKYKMYLIFLKCSNKITYEEIFLCGDIEETFQQIKIRESKKN